MPPTDPSKPQPSAAPAAVPAEHPATAPPAPAVAPATPTLAPADPTTPAPIVMPSATAAAQAPQPVAPAPVVPAAPEESPSGDESPHPIKGILSFLLSWVIVPGLLVLFVHNFVFQAWYVDGQSMYPSFENGDYLIVSKWDVSLKKLTGQSDRLAVKRGDVVIFNPPSYTGEIFFIKRAIGLPGERVVIKDGTIRIYNSDSPSGLQLTEPYIDNVPLEGDIDQVVPEGELFVVGDNRTPGASHDSRAIGPIPQDHIIGTANIRLLPVSQFGTVEHPTYQ